jgi:DNA-binding CsgD family transcriptional regulator
VKISEEAYLAHYGILRKSGRYPWGSGGTQSQRNKDFLAYVEDMRRQGLSEAQIAKGIGISTTQLRASKSIARNEQKQQQINQAQRLKDKGYSNVAIGERMGINESSVRSLLDPGARDKADILESTSEMLKRQVEEKKYIDVGTDVHRDLPIGDNPAAFD